MPPYAPASLLFREPSPYEPSESSSLPQYIVAPQLEPEPHTTYGGPVEKLSQNLRHSACSLILTYRQGLHLYMTIQSQNRQLRYPQFAVDLQFWDMRNNMFRCSTLDLKG